MIFDIKVSCDTHFKLTGMPKYIWFITPLHETESFPLKSIWGKKYIYAFPPNTKIKTQKVKIINASTAFQIPKQYQNMEKHIETLKN